MQANSNYLLPMSKVVQVAVAILQKQNGEFLLASRPHGKGWAGWWEFPGGKIEAGEVPEHALLRELQEELGVTPTDVQPWITRRYDYPATHDAEAKTVLLHFFFVFAWQGEVSALEGQTLAWQSPSHIDVSPILPANAPIMHALALPNIYAISHVADMGKAQFLAALAKALDQGLQLIQIREKHLNVDALSALTREVLTLCAPYGTKVMLSADIDLANTLGVHGVHLNSHALMQLDRKPDDLIVGASCHHKAELSHAEQLGLDFAVLSPVLRTQSHPDATPLGWETFAEMIKNYNIPIYALGGMQTQHLPLALRYGARGIAMQRGAWQANEI
jgi:8-oxo-dGTP diphosphatase